MSEEAPIYYNSGLAELIGVHGDIPKRKQDMNYPYLSKSMQFGNMTQNEILDIKDDLLILNIIKRSGMTRGEKIRAYARGDFIETRSILTAGLSLSRGGELMKRLTGMYQHVETSDNTPQPTKKGLWSGFKGNSGGGE